MMPEVAKIVDKQSGNEFVPVILTELFDNSIIQMASS